jgi:hypothetical protein
MKHEIRYKEGYNYQLYEADAVQTGITPPHPIMLPFVRLNVDGVLYLAPGYAWDGPSGPAIDTKNFMRGSLYHDALYQLMRAGMLDPEWRQAADELLVETCKEDGMWAPRRAWVLFAVRTFAARAAEPQEEEILVAP